MEKLNGLIVLLGILFIGWTSCGEPCENPDGCDPKPPEIITTLTYKLTPVGGGASAIFLFRDLDGNGGNPPSFVSENLSPNTTYEGSIELLNESGNTMQDITREIEEEGVDHQFFFESSITDMSVSYDDTDIEGNPIGLKSRLTTGNEGSGTLTITLRHKPIKTATGVMNGNISNAGGETDIQVTFDTNVK